MRMKYGDRRVIAKFLVRPITIGNETRHLEWARIEQRWASRYHMFEEDCWVNERWVNTEPVEEPKIELETVPLPVEEPWWVRFYDWLFR